MVGAQNPLLFLISEPPGSPTAQDVAARLGEHGVRTWMGSLAPAGELEGSAMDALRASAAVLLVFDAAAARSRDVDRHLLVARQTGKPLIPLRFEATDEGLLRQELLDAHWVDAAAPGALSEVTRRAFEHAGAPPPAGEARKPRIELLQAGTAAGAGAAASAGAAAGAAQASGKPRIEVLQAGPAAATAADAPVSAAPLSEQAPRRPAVERRGGGFLRSPTLLIALLALAVLVAAVLYNSSRSGDGRAGRTVTEETAAAEDYGVPQVEEQTSAAAEPDPAPVEREAPAPAPAPAAEPDREPSPAPAADAEPAAAPEAREEAAADAAPAADASSGVATVRAFYAALSRGDGASAARLVVPGKRQSGPLSGPALSRYFSSFRRPLRLRSAEAVDANTVRVAYDYVLGDGRLCQGQATVDLVRSGDQGLVSGIRTRGPC